METSPDSVEPDVTVTDLPAIYDGGSALDTGGPAEALALLSVSAARDDLGMALAKRPRARIPSLTLLLGVLLVAGLGFIGGEFAGKNDSGSGGPGLSASALRSAFAGRGGTGASGFPRGGAGSAGGGLFGSGNATVGSVKLVQGSTVYVQTTSGSIVLVSTTPSTKITISSTGTVHSLKPGDQVIVSGTKNSTGGVAATSISQTSLGTTGGAG